MKYYATGKQIVYPEDYNTKVMFLRKSEEWIRQKQSEGILESAYSFAAGGGFLIFNVSSHEELIKNLIDFPMYCLSEFKVEPLVTFEDNAELIIGEFKKLGVYHDGSALTRVYHIAYTPELKEICLFFWGCNIECRGCYCKRRIYSPMLPDFLGAHREDPTGIAPVPEKFLTIDELMAILDKYEFTSVVLEGQEAGLDPEFATITRLLHERYHSKNLLLSNGLQLPDLSHVDRVEIGIKAVSDHLNIDYTGVSNTLILENLDKLVAAGKDTFVESVYIPGYIDIDEIERIAEHVASVKNDMLFVILPYFKAGDNPWRRPTTAEMECAAEAARKHLSRVFFFRGDEELKYKVTSAFPVGLGEIQGNVSPPVLAAKEPDKIAA
ncbi:Pyruvate-formate lyase-activating enzyme [Dehalogenimonas formicexedens]|uniref:Pyruvate-formate lyase-activating enzyme n=1 Tax=Dehalogenimonas formicexedens TaxID=1839801 RepID=A0A1P8F657_9CHLR|nr:radical SAM protein [Dehalogenimonas formicexedens]APV43961.1 Pyruvate-formate lyase-activating enzyme [Dehalogenimonas formicexedens]